jgi:hypothetical protein
MPFSLTVHHFRRDPRTNHRVLIKTTPYIAISSAEGRLFVQTGKVWSEGGQEITDPPVWFWEGWAKIRPERRKQFGLAHPVLDAAAGAPDKGKSKAA